MSINKTFTVDKFLGLHEPSDGSTELKRGEAATLENFYITDDYNLKTRPGVSPVHENPHRMVCGIRSIYINNQAQLMTLIAPTPTEENPYPSMEIDLRIPGQIDVVSSAVPIRTERPVKIFSIQNRAYIVGAYYGADEHNVCTVGIYDGGDGVLIHPGESPYTPLYLSGCAPAGGGTELERINLLSPYIRVQFSADGETSDYVLPPATHGIVRLTVDGVEIEADGKLDTAHSTYRHTSAFPKGVNNVEFVCDIETAEHRAARIKFLNMRHCETFNGATDARIFFYGDDTNVCYYSGIPAYGSGLYIPAGNEIAVDASSSPITGMRRHYTRLMAFKPDGAFSINYEPVTLTDGRVIAGFYVHPASRCIGNQMDNQIQTVNNYPRTFCNGSLYEWRHTGSYYQDERYAKRIAENVSRTLTAANPDEIVTCDDNVSQTYYMFLNDDRGTVLVNRYQLNAWTMYTGELFRNITDAEAIDGSVFFCTGDAVLRLDQRKAYDTHHLFSDDASPREEAFPIKARWESGYHPFEVDYKRKYSSYLWISMLPEVGSQMNVTVKTDRRDAYLTKTVGNPLFTWSNMDFSNFSFLLSKAPRMRRIKIKVKKFVYYKLIFTVEHPGARATVLGYDQQVRYSSNVK